MVRYLAGQAFQTKVAASLPVASFLSDGIAVFMVRLYTTRGRPLYPIPQRGWIAVRMDIYSSQL